MIRSGRAEQLVRQRIGVVLREQQVRQRDPERRQPQRRDSPRQHAQADAPELEPRRERDEGEDQRRPNVDREPEPEQPRERDPELDQRVRPPEDALALVPADLGREHRGGHRRPAPADPRAGSSATIQPPASSTRRSQASRDEALVVGRGEDGAPLLDQLVEGRHERLVAPPVLAERRLVEGEEERPAGEPGHEREAALLAAGEPVRAPIAERLEREREPLAQLVGVADLLGARPSSTSSRTVSPRNPSSGSCTT